MFCPKCGKSEQSAETFCRQCGVYLPDFDKIERRESTPAEHLKANLVLNVMTAVASLALAITLYVRFLGEEDTPFIIYLTAGFLTAMFAWQAQVFWRNLKLKKQIVPSKRINKKAGFERELNSAETRILLNELDLSNVIEADFSAKTTNKLKSKKSS